MTWLIIIFLIILMVNNSKLKKENQELKKIINEGARINSGSSSNFPLNNEVVANVTHTNVAQSGGTAGREVVKQDNPSNKQGNSASLFIVGSILVVLASLIFLVSSWDLLPGLIKTIILICFQLFFNMMSNVCRDKYKLEKASASFFCLVMAFVPIVLLSLSVFGVVGEFLSINGEGFLLYLGITFALSDVIYKVLPTTRIFVRKFGVVSEILAILFVLVYFGVSYKFILFVLSIYNILIFILLNGGYLEKRDYFVINSILLYLNLFHLIINTKYEETIFNVTLLIYAGYHFYKLFWIKEEKNKQLNILLGILCYAFGIEMICDLGTINYYFLYLLFLLPLFGLCFVLKEDKENSMIYGLISVIGSLFVIINTGLFEKNYYWVIMYVMLLLIYVISFIIGKKQLFKYLSYLGIYLVLGTFFYINGELEAIKYISLGLVAFMYGLEWFMPKLKDKNSNKVMISVLILDAIIMMNSYSVCIPLAMIIALVIKEKENEYYLLVPILCGLTIFYINEGEINNLLFLLTIMLLSLASIYRKKINVYSICSFVSIFMSLNVIKYESFVFSLILFIWGISHIIVNNKEKNEFYKLVTAFSGLSMYVICLNEMEMNLVSVYSLGYFVTLIVITKSIFNDDSFGRFISSFLFFIICLTCLVLIRDEFDGLLEIFILFMIAVFSYNKYKSYFTMSVIFIFIYVLIQNAEFLFMIPWYVYVLGIGLAFIMLGVNDEKKKKKIQVQNTEEQNKEVIVNDESIELPKVVEVEKSRDE